MTKSIKQIFKEDQSDRMSKDIDWKIVSKNDKRRRSEIKSILDSGRKLTSEELYYAAMVYHHSGTKMGTREALNLAKLSVQASQRGKKLSKWGKNAKWLTAGATDRLLLLEGKPQKYGTQYHRKDVGSPLELARYDKNTTDIERKEFNVPPLKQILKELAVMNREHITKKSN